MSLKTTRTVTTMTMPDCDSALQWAAWKQVCGQKIGHHRIESVHSQFYNQPGNKANRANPLVDRQTSWSTYQIFIFRVWAVEKCATRILIQNCNGVVNLNIELLKNVTQFFLLPCHLLPCKTRRHNNIKSMKYLTTHEFFCLQCTQNALDLAVHRFAQREK